MGFFIFFVFCFIFFVFCFFYFFLYIFLFFYFYFFLPRIGHEIRTASCMKARAPFDFILRELVVSTSTQYARVASIEPFCAGVFGSHLLVEANDLFAGRDDSVTNNPHPERTNSLSGLETLLAYSERFAVADLSDDIQEGVELPDNV